MVIRAAGETMTIKYSDGKAFEAMLLSRTETTILLAVDGAEDVLALSHVNGSWLPADCKSLSTRFAQQQPADKPVIMKTERCCSRELAARLLRLSLIGRKEKQN